MTSLESSGLNAGYVGQLLEQYLENPEAVDPAWRALFEEGDGELLSALPGLERLVRTRGAGSGNGPAAVEAPAERLEEPVVVAPPPKAEVTAAPPDEELLAGVAAAMSLVKAYRMHGHLNARLDPLGLGADGGPRARRDTPRPGADPGAAGAHSRSPPPALGAR